MQVDVATVLVADDEPHVLRLAKFRLEREGYKVLTAEDGETALEMARAQLPDLCVLDVMMPKRSGFDVLHELRADERCRGIKVIMLTAGVEARDADFGRSLGADDYIRKPFAPLFFSARIRSVLDADTAPPSS